MQLHYPFQFDHRRRTAATGEGAHIRELIEQVLFTAPGERVNRPDFGSGLMLMMFAPNSDQLSATTQMIVQSALQQWLGELILVEAVEIENDEAVLRVTVRYVVRRTQTSQVAEFTRGAVG